MSSHLVGEAADFSTYLTGSTKRLVPFHVTGISSVQLLVALGTTSTVLHLVTKATAPLLAMMWPLLNTWMRLDGLSAPVMASSLSDGGVCGARGRLPPVLAYLVADLPDLLL
jgi:hypothetical protein